MYFYKIITTLTKDQINDRFMGLSLEQQREAFFIEELIIASIELYYPTGTVAFYVLAENSAHRLFSFYDEFIDYYKYNLTIDALNSFYRCSDKEIKRIVANEGFQEMLKGFILNNADQDIVLDKILQFGMESLNPIDYDILSQSGSK